ncbi:MAG: ribosome-associated translation inhibitor RaiA [Draconibacterium sp.]|nr:ribosome-associated translation inhibitor RaiA [Draconibacterium sp.]
MNVKIHSIKFDADVKLLDFTQKKMDKLDKFFDRIIDGEVFLRLNNEGINNKTVVIKVNLPGEQFLAESDSRTFEAAIEDATSVLKRKLRKHKEKLVSH